MVLLGEEFRWCFGAEIHTTKDAKERRNLEMRENELKEEISQAADLVAQVTAENGREKVKPEKLSSDLEAGRGLFDTLAFLRERIRLDLGNALAAKEYTLAKMEQAINDREEMVAVRERETVEAGEDAV